MCYYCNCALDMELGDAKLSKISIDRVDNSSGHIIDNCVISCLFCNNAKNSAEEQYYKDFINVLQSANINKKLEEYEEHPKHPKLINNMISGAIHSDKKKGSNLKVISVVEIKELLEKQNGCCAITGIKFINAHINKFPFKMSLDRIDNSKLHTVDNCQLVCMAIQYGRNNKSIEEIKEHIEKIKNTK